MPKVFREFREARLSVSFRFMRTSLRRWARMETLRGRVAAARELYKRASGLFPEDAHLLIEWGKLCSEERDVDAARSLFSRVLALRTPPTYGYQCAAALEAREGNAEAARA
eukprot:4552229-Pleurochrysis_carterae.AAC.1